MVEHAKILLWRPSFETILADSPAKPVCVEFQNQMRSSSMARNRVRKFVSEALIRCRAAAKSRIVSAEMHSSPNACFSCELKKPWDDACVLFISQGWISVVAALTNFREDLFNLWLKNSLSAPRPRGKPQQRNMCFNPFKAQSRDLGWSAPWLQTRCCEAV